MIAPETKVNLRPQVLIADDEMSIRLIIRAYFSPYEVDVHEVKSGSAALEFIRSRPTDLLILDYTMPLMTGKDVLLLLKREHLSDKFPIIVYTAGGFDYETEKWLKKTATAFLEKTSLGEDLIPTVKDILGDRMKLKPGRKE